ncbi:hypothetical protein KUTeg_009552 [Tegillarca granosa]|uniref:Potassium channel tetramerisation-type BTB domain-containing protein n=1 Tax=Tegillarca granosa TaxID=220873 RepID=A0ABQ9F4B3_TEGGR|nr:hypothetical protein KUTeg_009552 [Tegillarca granosa]
MWAKIASSSAKKEKDTTDKNDGPKDKSKKDDISDSLDDLITLNVGGIKHQSQISTLKKLKNTRLTNVADIAKSSGQREFFFDRHPDLFPYILNFYRSGKLHMPTNICGPLIKEELHYWKIDDKDIQQCCWVHYINHEETFDMIERFEKDEHHHKVATEAVSEKASFFKKQRT